MWTRDPNTFLAYRYKPAFSSPARVDVLTGYIFQALAAVGQCRLMSLWDGLFSHLRLPVAQILLTRNDIADVRTHSLQLWTKDI